MSDRRPDAPAPLDMAGLAQLLDAALDLEPDVRATWLAGIRRTDPAAADQVASLLAREPELAARGFLDRSASLDAFAIPTLAGQEIGPYTLLRPLGRGGMGGVWLARRSDGRYEGEVAIKLLNLSLLDPIGCERFRREGSTLARVTHPNIAHLIDAGVTPLGHPYLVLERVDGERIDEYCDRRRLAPEDRLRLFRQVLAAVAHAHASLVVHRDLKPSNILVTADGVVKLLDFGIAKLLEAETGAAERTELTEAGGALLTPEYAAPEQVTGAPITAATDVYALGVLLYVLLAGAHPAGKEDPTGPGRLRHLLEHDPVPLAQAVTDAAAEARSASAARLRKLYGGDLGTIVAMALEKDPARRYPTASALRDDLDRFLRHEPVHARPAGAGYRARKFIRRNRVVVTLAGSAMLGLLAATGVAWTQMREARRQRDVAQAQRDRAVFEERRAAASNGFMLSLLSGIHPSERITTTELIERARQLLEQDYPQEPRLIAGMLLDIAGELGSSVALATRAALLTTAAAHAAQAEDAVLEAAAQCALARFHIVKSFDPDSAAPYLARAEEAMARAGQVPTAIANVCLLVRSRALALAAEPERAMEILAQVEAAEATRPDSVSVAAAHAQIEVAEQYGFLGRFERELAGHHRARRILARLGRANTMQYLTSLLVESRSLQNLGRHRQSDSIFALWEGLATRLGPGFALVVSNSRAQHALQNGHPDEAVRLYAARMASQRAARQPPDVLTHGWLCRSLIAAGRVREANECVAEMPPAGKDEIDAMLARARVADGSGDADRALELYMELLRRAGYPELQRPRSQIYVLHHAARMAHATAANPLADTLAGYGLAVIDRLLPESRALRAQLTGLRSRIRLALGDSTAAETLATRALRDFGLMTDLLADEAAARDSAQAVLVRLSQAQ